MKKGVLFDLDDTLYDYDKYHEQALKDMFKIINKKAKISFKEFLRLYQESKEEVHRDLAGNPYMHSALMYMKRIFEKLNMGYSLDSTLKIYDIYIKSFLGRIRLYKKTIPLFEELRRRKIKIAVVTGQTEEAQLRKIKHLKISKYIDLLVTSEEAGKEKPHSSSYSLALNKLNMKKEDVLFVGDNPKTDIQGSNVSGIDSVLLKRSQYSKIKLTGNIKPNFIIKDIYEVLRIIDKN
jgi:HAD superfamily hydrolase (TIGR01549 family)